MSTRNEYQLADGRMTVADLADRIGLTRTPTQLRLRRLTGAGVIRGFRAIVDPIGRPLAQRTTLYGRIEEPVTVSSS